MIQSALGGKCRACYIDGMPSRLYPDLSWWIRLLRGSLLAFGLLIALIAVGELLRIHEALYHLHPWAGHSFLILLAAFLGYVLLMVVRFFVRRPVVLPDLPSIEPLDTASMGELCEYRELFLLHSERLLTSSALDDNLRQQSGESLRKIAVRLREIPLSAGHEELANRLREAEALFLQPLLATIDQSVEEEIRRSTVEVMTAVTLSPWHSLDLGVALYRGTRMVLNISALYGSRPTLRENLIIFRDVLGAVATVSLVNAGQKLIEGLARQLPGISRIVDDIIQGVGAGYFINLAGWAARDRCRSLHRWEPARARLRLHQKLGRYVSDLRSYLIGDLWSTLWKRMRGSDETESDTLREAFDRALRELSEKMPDTDPEPDVPHNKSSVLTPLGQFAIRARRAPGDIIRKLRGE